MSLSDIKFNPVRVYEKLSDPFSGFADNCKVVPGSEGNYDVICRRTGVVVVHGMKMTSEMKKALTEDIAQDGKIKMVFTNSIGRNYDCFITTKNSY